MNKISILLIPFLIVIGACGPFESDLPTQTPATPTLFPPTIVPDIPFIGDGGLISDQPCASPCFYGVRIGETKFDQVVPVLESNGIFPCFHDDPTTILCGYKILVGMSSSTNLVDSVGYYPDTVISIKELLFKYGVPNTLLVVPTGIPEATKIVVLLLFDTLKMRIILPEIDGREYSVTSSTKIELVNYFDDTIYAGINGGLFSQSWKGYTTYTPDQ